MKNIVGRREFVLRILERADMGGFGMRELAFALHKGLFSDSEHWAMSTNCIVLSSNELQRWTVPTLSNVKP